MGQAVQLNAAYFLIPVTILHKSYYTLLNSSQAATILPRPKSEGRKSIAQCASTGNHAQDALAPERGVRIDSGLCAEYAVCLLPLCEAAHPARSRLLSTAAPVQPPRKSTPLGLTLARDSPILDFVIE